MRTIFVVVCLSCFQLYGQDDDPCFYINSILVHACRENGNEPYNEMVRFRVLQDLNISDIDVDWPNKTWLGLVQNEVTSSIVELLNEQVEECGLLLEPENGILPGGYDVILIPGAEYHEPGVNSFAKLQDTLYVIFQNDNDGVPNNIGHFKNYESTSDCESSPSGCSRTLEISFGNECVSTVTYRIDSLVKQDGTLGRERGALANFDETGFPTYANPGCQAPIVTLEVTILEPTANFTTCVNEPIQIEGALSGPYALFFWSSDSGAFEQTEELITSFTPASAGEQYIYLNASNPCNDTISDSVLIEVIDVPSLEIIIDTLSNQDNCILPGEITLSVDPDLTVQWTTGEQTNSIIPDQSGDYAVESTNACGNNTALVNIDFDALPTCAIEQGDELTICNEESVVLSTVPEGENNDILWSTGEATDEINVSTQAMYYLTVSNDCGVCEDSIFIDVISPLANFELSDSVGNAPLTVIASNTSQNYDSLTWYLDQTLHEFDSENSIVFDSEGFYTLTLVVEDTLWGCTSETSKVIEVIEDMTLVIPNVFTPNNDGKNDIFGITPSISTEFEVVILNRWGNLLLDARIQTKANEFSPIWDGKINGKFAVSGVYFYKILMEKNSGEQEEYHGYFHLNTDREGL